MKFEMWRKAAETTGRWFRRVEGRSELLRRTVHETKRRRAAEQREMAVAAPSPDGI